MITDQEHLDLPAPAATDLAVELLQPLKRQRPFFESAGQEDEDRIADALSWLRLLVIQRDSEVVDQTAQNLAYIDLALEYPTHLVIGVIKRWPRECKYWPAWSELEEKIKEAVEAANDPDRDRAPKVVRMIVKPGSSQEFAEKATKRYGDLLGRDLDAAERKTLFGQALKVASGVSQRMGLVGCEQWLSSDLPKLMPGYSNFISDAKQNPNNGR